MKGTLAGSILILGLSLSGGAFLVACSDQEPDPLDQPGELADPNDEETTCEVSIPNKVPDRVECAKGAS